MVTGIVQEGSPLGRLPTEIFVEISEYLDPASFMRLCRTCFLFNHLIGNNQTYWKALYTRLGGSTEPNNGKGYKHAVFIFCHGNIHEKINALISELIPSSLPEDVKRCRTAHSGQAILAFSQLGQLDPVHTPTLFLAAIRHGRSQLVRRILDSIALPPELMINGLTQAVFFQKFDLVELLIERQQLNDEGRSDTLLAAAQSGQVQMLKFIQERLGPFSSQENEQATRGQAVVNAIMYNQDDGLIKYLLDTGPIDTESYDRAIELAAANGKIEIMRHLIQLDPPQGSIFLDEFMRQSAMAVAVENSHVEIFKL